jgi:spore coat polysaccharide biosynthesis protein SpsF (cytidylyltransferase family)
MTVAIIQARMGSTRLPGKPLADIGGASMLARVIRRVRRSRADVVVVATSVEAADTAIVAEAAVLGVAAFRGSEDDVLDRFHQAACGAGADVVIRVTADCPLVDPAIIDAVLDARERDGADYASNTLERTFPHGLDVEVATAHALAEAWTEARRPHERAHVFPFLYQQPDRYRLTTVRDVNDRSAMRWTVDTADDLTFMRTLYGRFDNDDAVDWRDAVRVVEREPSLGTINAHVRQKTLEEC